MGRTLASSGRKQSRLRFPVIPLRLPASVGVLEEHRSPDSGSLLRWYGKGNMHLRLVGEMLTEPAPGLLCCRTE